MLRSGLFIKVITIFPCSRLTAAHLSPFKAQWWRVVVDGGGPVQVYKCMLLQLPPSAGTSSQSSSTRPHNNIYRRWSNENIIVSTGKIFVTTLKIFVSSDHTSEWEQWWRQKWVVYVNCWLQINNFFMETEENLAENLAKLEKQAVNKRTGMPVLVIFGGILVLFVLVLNIAC